MCMVAGYRRVSTETQSEKGFGLDTQEREIRRYCVDHGITLDRMFTDAGISGNLSDTADDEEISKREGLMDLLSSIQEGGKVIVLNTSRLWRSDMTKALVKRELMKRKVQVISIQQPTYDLYSKDPSDYLINSIMEILDAYERMSISLKLAKGRTSKAKGGDKPAGIMPYGYQYSADKKHAEINLAESEIVKRMFSEAQTGKSLNKIASGLNADGITTRQGKQWAAGSIQVILHNTFYIGVLTHKGKAIDGNHTPIISKVQFGKVQKQLEKRNKKD